MTTDIGAKDVLELLPQPFTTAHARNIGIGHQQLRRLVDECLLRRVLRDVYVDAAAEDTIDLRISALALVARPHAVVCDRTAAWLWGVDAFRFWELDIVPPLETIVLRGRTRIRRPGVRGGERDLQTHDYVVLGDVRVTTPARTSLDLACRLSQREALAVMDQFARIHGVTSTVLTSMLPRFRGRRGIVRGRGLVPLVDSRSESAGESFCRFDIAEAGLPAPQPQYWVKGAGVSTYRLDLAYPRLKICVEYDGEEFHSSDEDRENDRERRKWLRDHGWVVVVVTKDDLRGPAREAWLSELRSALAERMW